MRYPMVSPNIAIEKQENDNNLNKPMDLGVPYLQTNPEQKAMHVFVDVLHAWISYEAWPIMGGSKILKIENVQRNNPGKPMVWGTPNSRNTQLNWNQASGKPQILQAPPYLPPQLKKAQHPLVQWRVWPFYETTEWWNDGNDGYTSNKIPGNLLSRELT